jgi:hypothetical protein
VTSAFKTGCLAFVFFATPGDVTIAADIGC